MAKLFAVMAIAEMIQQVGAWLRDATNAAVPEGEAPAHVGCVRLEVVGDVRRGASRVPVVELLMATRNEGCVIKALVDMAWQELVHLVPEQAGHQRFIHCESGIPFALHLCDPRAWWTALVYRTGPDDFVRRLQATALRNGYELSADGIRTQSGARKRPHAERDVFRFVGAAWIEPADRSVA